MGWLEEEKKIVNILEKEQFNHILDQANEYSSTAVKLLGRVQRDVKGLVSNLKEHFEESGFIDAVFTIVKEEL
jgi:uncharacterized protein (DUF111 family)